jgi:hypothetical protein
VVLFNLVQQKRYTSSKILVVVTQAVHPSVLPALINMTPTRTTAPSDTQMPGSVTQPIFSTSFHLPDDDAAADDDDDATVITTNSKVPSELTGEYNIKLLMTNKQQDISDPALQQQATMVVLHAISQKFGSDLDSRSTFFLTSSTASFYDNIQLDLSDCDQSPPVVEAPADPSVTSSGGISSTVSSPPWIQPGEEVLI